MASPLLGPGSSRSTSRWARSRRHDSSSLPIVNSVEERNPFNSEIEFLDSQKADIDVTYKSWSKIYIISAIVAILYSIVLVYLWFRWVFEIKHDTDTCAKLKLEIIWVSVVYLIGITVHIVGVAIAYQQAFNWFPVYNIMIILICVVSVKIDLEAVNHANESLQGCIRATVNNISNYIYTTVIYCTWNMGLIAAMLKLSNILKKREKAEDLYEDYMVKTERQVISFV